MCGLERGNVVLGPRAIAFGFDLGALDSECRIIVSADASVDRERDHGPQGDEKIPRGWWRCALRSHHGLHMLFLDRGNALVAVLFAKSLQNVAAGGRWFGGANVFGGGREI